MKIPAMILAAGLIATPASAGVATIEFVLSTGEKTVWAFDDSTMTATADGEDAGAYTWDEAGKTVCGNTPEDGEVCATFDVVGSEVGHTTPFTMSTGQTGVATVTGWQE